MAAGNNGAFYDGTPVCRLGDPASALGAFTVAGFGVPADYNLCNQREHDIATASSRGGVNWDQGRHRTIIDGAAPYYQNWRMGPNGSTSAFAGGTSLSAPAAAGLAIDLVDQYRNNSSSPGLLDNPGILHVLMLLMGLRCGILYWGGTGMMRSVEMDDVGITRPLVARLGEACARVSVWSLLSLLSLGCSTERSRVARSGEPFDEANRGGTSTQKDGGVDSGVACRPGRSAGDVLWVKEIYTPGVDGLARVTTLAARAGGGFIASGRRPSDAEGTGWVASWHDDRSLAWEDWVLPSSDTCDAIGLDDGGILASCTITVDCGSGDDFHDCDRDAVFIRYGADGTVAWQDRLTAEAEQGNDGAEAGVELADGEVVVAYDLSAPSGERAAYLRRYTRDGEIRWDEKLTRSGELSIENAKVLVGSEGANELYAIGSTAEAGHALMKLDSSGQREWVLGASDDGSFTDITPYVGGVAVVGTVRDDEGYRAVLEVVDTGGGSVWKVEFPSQRGGRALGNAIAATSGGRLFVAINDENDDGESEASIVEVTSTGDELGRTTGFGDFQSRIYDLSLTDGCSLLVAGGSWKALDGGYLDIGIAAEMSL